MKTITLTSDMDIDDIVDSVDELMEHALDTSDEWERVDDWKRVRLDPRVDVIMWVESGGYRIITKGRTNRLEYYGGFEYVDKDAIIKIGDYTIWNGDEDERVQGHAMAWNGEEEDEEDEDDEC